jgi:ATP-binding cassette subfamily C protein LapB
MTETIVIPHDATPPAGPERADYSPWLEAILKVARHYRLDVSPESIRLVSVHSEGRVEEVVRHMARQAGLSVKFAQYDHKSLSRWRTPLLVQMRDGQVGVIESVGEQGELGIAYSGDQGLQSRIDPGVLTEQALRTVVLRPVQPLSDVRTDDYIKPYDEHWFRRIVLNDLRPYGQVMLASLVANLLGMAGVLFSMQVYDRVIPAESLPTLYVLFGGVTLALVFDFVMRIMRLRITDVLGKRADLRVSDLVFGHALRLRNSARPKSTGSFISQLRELEQIRDLITSSTATALADMPFFFLFLLVFDRWC